MKLYCGLDLHANNTYLGIIDEKGKRLHQKKLANDKEEILGTLKDYRDMTEGVVVESTYNWYWLVDLLGNEGFPLHLANPSAIQKYKGLKFADDKSDAFWLAEMLRLGILPEGYIYPRETRPVRDLLRKRAHLVRVRTSLILSLEGIITRNLGVRINARAVKDLKEDRISGFLAYDEDLALAGRSSKECIDFLTVKINEIEKAVEKKARLNGSYQNLLALPGVGNILGVTIMLESGPVERFSKSGHYVSYCRKVPGSWVSNSKVKGKGNTKNGNKYLAWAFSEAAEKARCYDPNCRKYYDRKVKKTNRMVAHNALAHKLARAAYYIMKDGAAYDPGKMFA